MSSTARAQDVWERAAPSLAKELWVDSGLFGASAGSGDVVGVYPARLRDDSVKRVVDVVKRHSVVGGIP